MADYSKAIELDPKYAHAWYNRGVAYNKLGQPDKAVADFSRAIELDPKYAHAWNNRGVAYNKLGQPDKAVADFSKAIELDPKYALAWYNRGLAYSQAGPAGQGRRRLLQGHRTGPEVRARLEQPGHCLHTSWASRTRPSPTSPRPSNWTRSIAHRLAQPGHCLPQAGPAGQGRRRLLQGHRTGPERPRAGPGLSAAGAAHSRLAHFEQARTDYQTFLKRAPAHAGAHNDLAWLLATCPDAKLRDPDQAVELAKKAVQLAPKVGSYWKTLGVAHYRAGDWKAAVAALDKSLELRQGGDAVDQLFLAMAHRKLGNPDEARKAYEQAVQWLEKNKEALEKDKGLAEELRRFRAEAEEVLELKKK